MNYQKVYDQLIAKRQKDRLEKCPGKIGAVESHHIKPLCLNGEDIDANIVNLTPREHYMCHLLLWKIYPKSLGLHFALMSMTDNSNSTNQRKFKFNSKLYEKAKLAFAAKMKEYYKTNSSPIKGKRLVFNYDTGSIEYFDAKSMLPSNLAFVKVRWICNLETNKETQIPDFQDIPVGWRPGRRKNVAAAHTGLTMISNPQTFEVKYVPKGTILSDGWKHGKSRPMNMKKHKQYFKVQKQLYKDKAKAIYEFMMANQLSFIKLVQKFPELKEYKSSNYVMQLLQRNLDFDAKVEINKLADQLRKTGITPFEGRWRKGRVVGKKNQGNLHKVKRAVIGEVRN